MNGVIIIAVRLWEVMMPAKLRAEIIIHFIFLCIKIPLAPFTERGEVEGFPSFCKEGLGVI